MIKFEVDAGNKRNDPIEDRVAELLYEASESKLLELFRETNRIQVEMPLASVDSFMLWCEIPRGSMTRDEFIAMYSIP